MTVKEVKELAHQFSCEDATGKQNIVRQVYAEDGEAGLETLAQFLGLNPRKLAFVGQLGRFRKELSRRRRGQKPMSLTIGDVEAREIALTSIGQRRYARRDTLSTRDPEIRARSARKIS